jgi:hypothetical protein
MILLSNATQLWHSTFLFQSNPFLLCHRNSSGMPIKKFKQTSENTGPGDCVILSSTSHYTSCGLIEKKRVSRHTTSPQKSPSKSPEKPTHGLTPSNVPGARFDFDTAMLEPLKLPQSKVSLPCYLIRKILLNNIYV